MRIFKKYLKKNRYDIQFFCSSPIDEVWIRSILIKCHSNGIKVQLSVIGELDLKIKSLYLNKNIDIIDGQKNSFKKSAKYDCKLCITASSGINRNIYNTNAMKLIHMPHSLASLHMIYPENAFWGYDEIFCAGPHHKFEIQAFNELYNLNISTSDIGYGKFDLLSQAFIEYKLNNQKEDNNNKRKKILIAPSWGSDNILDKFGPELSMYLKNKNYDIIFRPHPIFFSEPSSNFKKIIELSKKELVTLESPYDGDSSIFYSDILIGDYSGINLEFAALRNKPLISVDVKNKVSNKNWFDLGITPIEIKIRKDIGCLVKPDLNKILEAVNILETNSKENNYKKDIYKKFLFNKGKCSEMALKRIFNLI